MHEQLNGDWMNEESDWDESTICAGGQSRTCEEVQDGGTNVLVILFGSVLFIAAAIFWGMK